ALARVCGRRPPRRGRGRRRRCARPGGPWARAHGGPTGAGLRLWGRRYRRLRRLHLLLTRPAISRHYRSAAMLTRRLSRPAAAIILAGQLGATITAQSAAVGLAVAVLAVLITAPVLPE